MSEKVESTKAESTGNRILAWIKTRTMEVITNKTLNKILVFSSFCPLIWLLVYLIVGKSALPGQGIFFSLISMVAAAHIVGFLFEKIKLPSLLGMLIVGIAFRNIPIVNIVGKAIDTNTSGILRNISFGVILVRAGLSLNLTSLKRLKWKILKLSVIPVLIEAIGFGLFAHFLLKMPILWTILMGFVVSGVSPAVVVPMMINIQEAGLGIMENIPALIIAASCIDNIVAITGHSLIIGVVFNSGQLWWIILQCPLQILFGVWLGIVSAVVLSLLQVDHLIKLDTLRFLFLLVISLVLLLGSKLLSFAASGPLAVLSLSITVKLIWEILDKKSSKDVEKNQKSVADKFSKIWSIIFLPFLFTLIGNEVDFQKINPSLIVLGSVCIFLALLFRMVATFLSLIYSGLNHKEKLFACFAWIPKATVQAALGSVALDFALAADNETEIGYGINILNIAVLSIILTAPLGTFLIAVFAKKFLKEVNRNGLELIPKA